MKCIEVLPQEFCIAKAEDYSQVNMDAGFVFLAKTDEENSLVCDLDSVPSNAYIREDGYRAFRIQGILDFSLIGILSEIASVLAANRISIFAVSTYNTDYVMVRKENLNKALQALKETGYSISYID